VPTPGFPAGTLGESGLPAWLEALTDDEDAYFTLHVVRGLAPTDALAAIGARPAMFMACVLPGEAQAGVEAQPPRQVFGDPGCEAVLLAGQVGAWTFVYDGFGDTESGEDPRQRGSFVSMAEILSAGDKEAATSSVSINAGARLVYAVDGDLLLHAVGEVDPERDDIPTGLRAAVESAGTFAAADDDRPDDAVSIRVACALARLNLTLEDLREVPLIGAPLG
jgi:hypothetical protein